MTVNEKIKYWQNRIDYYHNKYGDDCIEAKSARMNREAAVLEKNKPIIAANWNALGIAYE